MVLSSMNKAAGRTLEATGLWQLATASSAILQEMGCVSSQQHPDTEHN